MLMLRDQVADLAVENGLQSSVASLLPTPTTQDSSGRCRDHGGDLLHDIRCGCSRSDRKASKTSRSSEKISSSMKDEITDWGKFEPAIRRWELITGRAVPAPTKADGRDDAHRLSSRFTEWMMGLPEGWITDVGISRNDELKACGNGVVPQQAVLALQMILSRKSESKND
jgi:DNA (cytosine-5)-methyltransferase 1